MIHTIIFHIVSFVFLSYLFMMGIATLENVEASNIAKVVNVKIETYKELDEGLFGVRGAVAVSEDGSIYTFPIPMIKRSYVYQLNDTLDIYLKHDGSEEVLFTEHELKYRNSFISFGESRIPYAWIGVLLFVALYAFAIHHTRKQRKLKEKYAML